MDKINNNIKFGLKLWSTDQANIKEAKKLIEDGIFDYVELMVVPDTDISPFLNIKAPYIIHIPHDSFGLNIADKEKEKFNLEMINKSIEWADKLSAEYLILHPGFGEIETAVNFLYKINDKRILIENMPKVGVNFEKMVGYTPEQIKRLCADKFGFCLDLSHAIKASASLKYDCKKYLDNFLDSQPKIIHVCDGFLESEQDEHLDIDKGNFDFSFIAKYIKKSNARYITLETPRLNSKSLEQDLQNIETLKSYFI